MTTVAAFLDWFAHVIVIGWLVFLTFRAQVLLNHAEDLIDQNTPTLADDTAEQSEWQQEHDQREQPEVIDLEWQPDPEPATQPIPPQPHGPETQPAEAVIATGWEALAADWQTRSQQILDEAHTTRPSPTRRTT